MLLALMEDNITGSFYLRYSLCVLSMIIRYGAICTGILYTIIIFTNGAAQ